MFRYRHALILISFLLAITLSWFNCTDILEPDFSKKTPVFTLFLDSTCSTPLNSGDTLCDRDSLFFVIKTNLPYDVRNVYIALENPSKVVLFKDSSSTALDDSTFRIGCHVLKSTGKNTISIILKTSNNAVDTSIIFEVVGMAPYLISNLPIIAEVEEGETCILSISADGTGQLDYSWYRNNEKITCDSNCLVLTDTKVSHSGLYKCTVSSKWGTTSGSTTDLTVFPIGSPQKPDSLRITGKNSEWVMLEWNTVTGINKYQIYRDTAIYSSVEPLAVSNKPQYIDITKKGYYYWVTAYNGTLESQKSNWVSSKDTLQNIDTTIAAPDWKIDSIGITINEGSEYVLNLNDTCTNSAKNQLAFKVISNTPKGIVSPYNKYIFFAGHLDSGKYVDMIIASNGSVKSDTMKITITVNPTFHTLQLLSGDNGSIDVSSTGIISDKSKYRWGDTLTVKASPDSGYTFSRWLGDIEKNDSVTIPLIIIMDSDKKIIAEFKVAGDDIIIKKGRDLNKKIKEIVDSKPTYARLYPEPGFYLEGTVKGQVQGKLKIIIENK